MNISKKLIIFYIYNYIFNILNIYKKSKKVYFGFLMKYI